MSTAGTIGLTLFAIWLLGFVGFLVGHGRSTGFYSPTRVSPRPSRGGEFNTQPMKWPYAWWQRPIAVVVDCAIWPYAVLVLVLGEF